MVYGLVADLSAGRIRKEELPERLRSALAAMPGAHRLAVFRAPAPGEAPRLSAPCATREGRES